MTIQAGKSIEVLITGGDTRPGLAVARSLARHGVSLAVTGTRNDMAFRSRYVAHAMVSPSSADDPRAFVDFIVETVKAHGVKLVMPLPDSDVFVLNQHRDEIEPHATLALARRDALDNALDKRRNLELARRVGVPCPRQFEMESVDQIPEMVELLGFPIVLKSPGPSTDPDRPDVPFRVLYAHDEVELRHLIETHCANGVYPLFQECAVGSVHNLCCFASRGEVNAIHQYHSVRRHQGAGVLRRVVAPMPEVEAHARAMMRALEWDGVAHLGFFVSKERDRIWYMETNGRFWGSVQGSVDAGWDFPFWVYRYFRFGDVPAPDPIRIGSLTCWHRGDLEALIQFLRGGDIPATGTNPTRRQAILQYLSGFSPAIHSDVFQWSDPMPGLVDHWRLVELMWHAGRRRIS